MDNALKNAMGKILDEANEAGIADKTLESLGIKIKSNGK